MTTRTSALSKNMVLRNTIKMSAEGKRLVTFTAREVSRLAGFEKPWMLNHLEREEIFIRERASRPGHGTIRGYTFRDVVILRAINRLLKLGARPKRIKESIRTFSAIFGADISEDELLEFARTTSMFVVTGEKVIYCRNASELVDLATSGQLAFSFMVDGSKEIFPSVHASVSYLKRVKDGASRGAELLDETAREFSI